MYKMQPRDRIFIPLLLMEVQLFWEKVLDFLSLVVKQNVLKCPKLCLFNIFPLNNIILIIINIK